MPKTGPRPLANRGVATRRRQASRLARAALIEACEPRRLLSVAASGNDDAATTPRGPLTVLDFTGRAGVGPYNPREIIDPAPSLQNAGFIGRNFEGPNRNASGFIPPDTWGAVGPNHIVILINGRYRVFNKDGAVQRDQSLDTFWQSAGVSPTSFSFDPRILYDAPAGRWYAISVDNAGADNNFLVAVSRTSNPLDGFVGFKIDSDAQTGQRWADYPQFGFDSDGVYVTANMFGLSVGGVEVNLLVLPKVDLLLSTPSVARRTLLEDIGSTSGFSTQPVVYDEPNAYPPELVTHGNSSINFATMGGTIFAPTVVNLSDVAVPFRSNPPLARQPDGTQTLNTGDSRQQSTVYFRNGSYYGAAGVAVGSRAGVRFYQISASRTLQLERGIGDAVLDFMYPSVAVNANGDVALGFSGSGPQAGQFASAYAVVAPNNAGTLNFSNPFLTRAGTSSYAAFDNSGRNRWGDYSHTVVDPANNNRFWTFQEFAVGPSTWSTQATELLPQAVAAPPATPILTAASDTGVDSTDGVTNDTTPTFTGTAVPNVTIRVYAGALLLGTGTSDGSGNWTITSTVSLVDGAFSITATADNGTGESVRSPGLPVTIDTTPPAPSGPPVFAFQTGHTLSFAYGEAVFASGGSALALVSLPSLAPVPGATFSLSGNGTPSLVFTASPVLPDGNFRSSLPGTAATDRAGNAAALASVDFFVFAGDANRSRTVDVADFSLLASNFNASPRFFGQGDFNYNGSVEIGDFAILAGKFNTNLPAPRPAGAAVSPFASGPLDGTRATVADDLLRESDVD